MELSKSDQKKIRDLVNGKISHPPKKGELLELEVRFMIKEGGIDYYQYRNILNTLTFNKDNGGLGLKDISQDNRLDIKAEDDIRLSVEGIENIKLYWLKNDLASLKKGSYKFIRKKRDQNIDLDDYGVRISLSTEADISSSNQADSDKVIHNPKLNKNYRLKNTYRIKSRDGLFRYDLSSVKMVNSTSLKKSGVFDQPVINEIEMEFIGEQENLDEIINSLLANIGIMLGLLQNNSLLISKSDEVEIIRKYFSDMNITYNPESHQRLVLADPVTLLPSNMIDSSNINIANKGEYAVTYKADGDRYVLYVLNNPDASNHGEIYLINNTLGVRRTGYSNSEWAGSIIEGEFIRKNNLYLAYDMLFAKGEDIRKNALDHPLIKKGKGAKNKTRIDVLDKFLEDIENTDDLVRIKKKTYKYSTEKNDIFQKVNELNDEKGLLEYEIDGYIFTPIKEEYPAKPGKWMKLLKWKPPDQNSIDFLVKTEKAENNMDIINPLPIHEKDTNTDSIRQYKSLILYVGGQNSFFDKDTKKWIKKQGPVEFNPYNLEYDNAKVYNRANIILNKRDRMSFYDKTGQHWEEILDDTVVEFVYQANREEGFRWRPIRVRHDKTTKYKRGEPIFGNYQTVANNIWESIVQPITFDILISGEIPAEYLESIKNKKTGEIQEPGESYYKECQVDNYNHANRLPYQNFHNLVVKMNLIKKYSPNNKETDGITKTNGMLLDLACGKSGDLSKWKNAGLKKITSIDIDEECIKYAKDFYDNFSSPKPIVKYLLGDSSKLIFPDYRVMLDKMDLKKYQESFPAKFMYDVVSLQFCLHYFFEKEVSIRTLLQNVNDNLKIGGYFIGTCFDGERIFELLKGKKGKPAIGELKDAVIWKIEKLYKPSPYPANKPNFGKAISVYTQSIGKTHNEYLVNFAYLDVLLQEYGFEKVKVQSFSEIYLEADIDNKNDKVSKSSQMSDTEKEFSFLNNAFVYKKIQNTPDKVYAKLKKLLDKETQVDANKIVKIKKIGGGGGGGEGGEGGEGGGSEDGDDVAEMMDY